ncbi:phytoene desaturase family protein [Winogradskyella ursingii]|uniref:phytoene desaturase family protein n=1 Tax=Winogradskyella ursingii TaxID=2686079 RepID=UPI0015C6CF0F|nr:NAD(P)/FAD-dependent oxidoreductase [Winogradskyella ursingii]
MSKTYDAVVIGSGPNGLAAAIALAQNQLNVKILEASSQIGGGTQTHELTLPGFKHDFCSGVHPLGKLSPYLKTLPLENYGLEWLYPSVSVAHPLDDGPAVLLSRSLQETSESIGVDGKAWEQMFRPFVEQGEQLLDDVLKPLSFPKHPFLFAKFGLKAMHSAKYLMEKHFKEDRAKALFAGCAAHSIVPLDFKFTSSFGILLALSGHLTDWPVAKGGSTAITQSMAAYFKTLGGEIQTNTLVKSLSQLPEAKAYIFDTDPKQFIQIADDALPSSYKARLSRFKYGPGLFKIDWALDGAIPWKDQRCNNAATVHLGGTHKEIALSEYQAWNNIHSEKPYVLVNQQSEIDPTRAPMGKHTGYAYCHVPHGSTKDLTAVIENQMERFAPGFKDLILKRYITNSKGFEQYNPNNVGGSISGGANTMGQLFARPALRWDPYTTPNKKLFICSASTPPGGGVHGMCGYWAAQSVLKKITF